MDHNGNTKADPLISAEDMPPQNSVQNTTGTEVPFILDKAASQNMVDSTNSDIRSVALMDAETTYREHYGGSSNFGIISNELVTFILQYLDAEDLGSMRLVQKRFAVLGRRFLCRNVNVMGTVESFDRLLEIASQDEEITRSVKHLQYIPTEVDRLNCRPYNLHDYIRWRRGKEVVNPLRNLRSDDNISNPFYFSTEPTSKLVSSWEKYTSFVRSLTEGSMWSRFGSELHPKLRKALDLLRPKSITVNNNFREWKEYHRDFTPWQDGDLRKYVTECFHKQAMKHKLYKALWDDRIIEFHGGSTTALARILRRAEEIGLELEGLTASFSPVLFSWQEPFEEGEDWWQLQPDTAFRSIKYLDLTLLLDRNELETTDVIEWNAVGHFERFFIYDEQAKLQIAQLLQGACSVEELFMMTFEGEFNLLPTFAPANIYWPKLRSCTLVRGRCHMGELADFILLHAKTLKCLELWEIELIEVHEMRSSNSYHLTSLPLEGEDEPWVQFMEQLGQKVQDDTLNLEKFQLYGDLGGCWPNMYDISWNLEDSKDQSLHDVFTQFVLKQRANIASHREAEENQSSLDDEEREEGEASEDESRSSDEDPDEDEITPRFSEEEDPDLVFDEQGYDHSLEGEESEDVQFWEERKCEDKDRVSYPDDDQYWGEDEEVCKVGELSDDDEKSEGEEEEEEQEEEEGEQEEAEKDENKVEGKLYSEEEDQTGQGEDELPGFYPEDDSE